MPTLTCQKCGATTSTDTPLCAGWLVAQRKDAPVGHLVVRCPEHITGHALRLAGLPQQSTSQRVEKYLDAGLWVEYGDGYIASVGMVEDHDGNIQYGIGYHRHIPPSLKAQILDTIEALILAMRQVEPDLRKWRVRKE